MSIKNYLRKHGYRPDLCDGNWEKFQKTLFKYLGEEKYDDYCEISSNQTSEDDIIDFVGTDVKLLKLFMSSQIEVSIRFTELIIEKLKKIGLSPKKILDLGGSDGWSSNYLRKIINQDSDITVVDKNKNYKPVEKNIFIHNITYSEFKTEEKFDLIISILGSPIEGMKELLTCIEKSLSIEGIVFLGLRISTVSHYIKLLEISNSLGLTYYSEHCEKISVFDESFPFICLKRSNHKMTHNEKLIISRKGFFNIKKPKRVYGYEVEVLDKLIKDGQILSNETYDFEDEGKFTVEIIEKNEILYRKSYNSTRDIIGDIIIEYPVEKNIEEYSVKKQLEKNTEENLFNNTL